MAPANVENHHENTVLTRPYGDAVTHMKQPMERKTLVRISKNQIVFDKEYMPN